MAGDERPNAETGQYENRVQAGVIDAGLAAVPNCTDAASTIFYRSEGFVRVRASRETSPWQLE